MNERGTPNPLETDHKPAQPEESADDVCALADSADATNPGRMGSPAWWAAQRAAMRGRCSIANCVCQTAQATTGAPRTTTPERVAD